MSYLTTITSLAPFIFSAAPLVMSQRKAGNSLEGRTEDLVEMARQNRLRGRMHGRKWLIERLKAEASSGRGFIIISGEPGTGKTAAVEELAYLVLEDRIPALKNTQILRLNSKEMVQREGLVGLGQELFYGTNSDLLGKIILELRDLNKDKKAILFIDEIQFFFLSAKTGTYNVEFLRNYLATLDEYGVLIIGATSNLQLAERLQRSNSDGGAPLARRVTDIQVPEMTSQETIDALKEGQNQLQDKYQIQLTHQGIDAIVMFSDSYHRRPNLKFPDKAIKFLERLASFVKNQKGSLTIDASVVAKFLQAISSSNQSETQFLTLYQNRAAREGLQKNFKSLFMPRIPIAQIQNTYLPICNLKLSLTQALNSKRQIYLVKTDSIFFLKLSLPNQIQNVKYRHLSIPFLLQEYSKEPYLIQTLLETHLLQMGPNEILVLEDPGKAFEYYLMECPASTQPHTHSSQITNPTTLDSSLFQQVRSFAEQGAALLSGSQPLQTRPTSISSTSTSFEILEVLHRWLNQSSNHRVILSYTPQIQRALESIGYMPLEIETTGDGGSMKILDLIDWLCSQTKNNQTKWIEKLVFVACKLSVKLRKEISLPDFCYRLYQKFLPTLDLAEPADENIASAINEFSNGKISLHSCQNAIKEIDSIFYQSSIKDNLDAFEMHQHLSEILETTPLAININLQEPTMVQFLVELIAKKTDRRIIYFSKLNSVFTEKQGQLAYLKHSLQSGPIILVVEKQDILNGITDELEELHLKDGLHFIFTHSSSPSAPQEQSPIASLANQALSIASSYLPISPPARNQDLPQVDCWLEGTCPRLNDFELNQQNFIHLFSYLISMLKDPIALENDRLQSISAAYYFLTQRGLSLTRMKASLSIDLTPLKEATNEKIAIHLARKFSQSLNVTKEDILYAINPNETTLAYRTMRKVKAMALFVFNVVITPFCFVFHLILKMSFTITNLATISATVYALRPIVSAIFDRFRR